MSAVDRTVAGRVVKHPSRRLILRGGFSPFLGGGARRETPVAPLNSSGGILQLSRGGSDFRLSATPDRTHVEPVGLFELCHWRRDRREPDRGDPVRTFLP